MNRDAPVEPSREDLIALIEALRAENASLKARITELERRLELNSSNSGKPPSSDGLKKPVRVKSLRERSGNRPGGQNGHKGETLRQVADPNEVVNHYPSACSSCGVGLARETSVGHSTRQVFDLPEPQPLVVTEHRAHDCQCPACGAKTRALFPDGVNAPVQYGARITAFVIYLLHYQLLPENRLAALMADLFGVKVATATIARMSRTCAERLRGFSETVRGLVAGAPVKHMDETGFRIGGKTQWLHVASTALLTFYRVCSKRGSLLAGVAGIVVHDHWKPYYTMTGVLHALCNAHHLRELKALVDIEKEDWARQMQRLLRRACHVANLARDAGVALKPGLVACIERRYDAIVAAGLAFHEAQPPLARAVARPGGKTRGRALAHLEVEHIPAYSPQARGRSERAFLTLQDRLPKELALEGIVTMEAANVFIRDVYVPAHNARFAINPEQEGAAFVALAAGVDLNEILCLQEDRKVGNDNCVTFHKLTLQIPESPLRPHFVKTNVKVRQYHDGTHAIFHGPRCIGRYDEKGAAAQAKKAA